MSRKRRRRKVGKHISLSATDADWEIVRRNAKRRGLSIARYLVELVEAEVDPSTPGRSIEALRERGRRREPARDSPDYRFPVPVAARRRARGRHRRRGIGERTDLGPAAGRLPSVVRPVVRRIGCCPHRRSPECARAPGYNPDSVDGHMGPTHAPGRLCAPSRPSGARRPMR